MASRPELKAAVGGAAEFLTAVQRADGGFDSFSSPSFRKFKKAFTYQTTFVPAVIMCALSELTAARAGRLQNRLARYLKGQAGPNGAFNYWDKASPERQRRPYPDDLDDTCLALAGLALHGPKAVSADMLANLVKLLLAAEDKVGGPYRTWLVSPGGPSVWQDVDLAVNANIAFLLNLVGEPLPNLNAQFEQAIAGNKLSSPYYVSAYPLIYFVARAYQGPLRPQLLALARKKMQQEKQLTPLKCALLLSSLIRLGDTDTAGLAANLLNAQEPDGSWAAEAFCVDPARRGRKHYNGSESLTTALAAEALALQARSGKRRAARRAAGYVEAPAGYRRQVLAAARRDTQALEPVLEQNTLDFLEKLADSSAGPEIIGLPRAFYGSLTGAPALPQGTLVRLSLANLYGWAAYTIFDDFLDEEGQPHLLPSATVAMRRSLDGFIGVLPSDKEFTKLVRQTFDTIDGANAWEQRNCRAHWQNRRLTIDGSPDYGDLSKLAERSLGHTLAPLAILRLSGAGDKLLVRAQQLFKHYLIARQLNDDLHDWQTDLHNGHMTFVTSHILADLGTTGAGRTWGQLLPLAQKKFWHNSLPAICKIAGDHTQLARRELQKLPLKRPNAMDELLDKIDASLNEALSTRVEARAFLKQFKGAQK